MRIVYMTIYLLALAIATIGGLLMKSAFQKKYGLYYNTLMAIIAILISGLRHFTVGHDTLQFYRGFLLLGSRPWSALATTTNYEWGYKIINRLLYTISSDPQILLFVTSTFIVIAFTVFIYRYSDGYILSWVIYLTWLFPNNENLLRQSLAVSVLLFGIPLLKRKEKWKYLLVVAFATLFHRSAIFALLGWFLVRLKNRMMAITICIATTLLGIVLIQTPLIPASIRYSNYFSHADYGVSDFFGNLFKLLIAVATLLFSYICLRKDLRIERLAQRESNRKQMTWNKIEEPIRILSNGSLLTINVVWIIIGILAININIFDRLFLYFDYFMLILLPRACFRLSKRNRLLVVPLIIALFIIMFILAVHYTNYAGVVPHRFFWQE